MFIDIIKGFFDNLKRFFEVHPTQFVIVVVAIVMLILATAAYIVISKVDLNQIINKDKNVLVNEKGLFSEKMNVIIEKKNKRQSTVLRSLNKEIEQSVKKQSPSDVTIINKKDEGRKMAEAKDKKTRVVNGKYEVFYDGKEYFYTLKASNGELLITSENYTSKETVLTAIEAVKRNVEVGTISIAEDKRGLFQFYLTAKNHRTLVMSANYPTEKRAIAASESFKRFAASSPVIEEIQEVEAVKEEIIIDTKDKKGGKLGVIKEENGYVYILKASNGELLVHSDFYKTEESALNALKNFKEAIKNGKFYVVKDKRDYYQFKLYSATGRIVEVGETYQSKQQAISSANSVCSFVELATVIEE